MQDIYAFDVGDFGKLGLLRHLSRDTNLPLTVLWWTTHLGSVGRDGRHTAYLQDSRYRRCDPQLFDGMAAGLRSERAIHALEPLFPARTQFHRAPVPETASRAAWLESALAALVPTVKPGLIFCDPDNGIALGERSPSKRHIGIEELARILDTGHSVVVYHHLNRSTPHEVQVAEWLQRITIALPSVQCAWGARFRRGTSRVFFVLSQAPHVSALSIAMTSFGSSVWVTGRHFDVVRLDGSPRQIRQKAIGDSPWSLTPRPVPAKALTRHADERKAIDMKANVWSADEVLRCLDAKKQRATYGAVAGVLGGIPQGVSSLLGPRRPLASWVVSAATGMPTGYTPDELAEGLLERGDVIRTRDALLTFLEQHARRSNPSSGPPQVVKVDGPPARASAAGAEEKQNNTAGSEVPSPEPVEKVLERVRDAVVVYAAARLSRTYGEKWQQQVFRGLHQAKAATDVYEVLKMFNKEWSTLGSGLDGMARSYANELLGYRNRWAHQQPISESDRKRLLDTAERLLSAIGAPKDG